MLGPSGSGKSSVVLAGLVPRLKAGAIEGSERWPVAILRPGDDPLKNLAAGVVPRFLPAGALPDVAQVLKLADDLRADARTLDVFAQMALHDRPEDVRLVVVVDQFEEVFTYRPQDGPARARFEQDRDQFFANLLNAAATPGGRVAVVLTMRSDFLSACAPFPQLSAVLSAHQELVGPMTAAELREAIERPAYLVGCEVGAGADRAAAGRRGGAAGGPAAAAVRPDRGLEEARRPPAHAPGVHRAGEGRQGRAEGHRGGARSSGERDLPQPDARGPGPLPPALPAPGAAGGGDRGHQAAGVVPRTPARRPRAGRGGPEAGPDPGLPRRPPDHDRGDRRDRRRRRGGP